MRTIIALLVMSFLFGCNLSVDTENEKDTTKLDSFMKKADEKLEKWGDSAKAKYKDAKDDVKEKLRRDMGAGRLQ